MAVPASRDDFKNFCLRKLGFPVIEINVDDDQVDDRVDEALSYYWDFHFDGSEKTFFKYQVTSTDITNKYLPVPDNVLGIMNLFDVGGSVNTNNLFNIRYQIALNDLYTLTSQSMVPYYMAMQHIQTLETILVGKQPLRYTRMTNKLYLDMDWGKVSPGDYIIAEAYNIVDPNTYTRVWSDRWLQRYAAALIKRQWGSNLTKFSGLNLPGGVQFNGQKIYDDATREVTELEAEMDRTYRMPSQMFIG
jgi:hypothetical protein